MAIELDDASAVAEEATAQEHVGEVDVEQVDEEIEHLADQELRDPTRPKTVE